MLIYHCLNRHINFRKMKQTKQLTTLLIPLMINIFVGMLLISCSPRKEEKEAPQKEINPPNIIYILADDLGYGDLSCLGQTKFSTPNIDQLAREGMRFTQHYSGNTVCAPS